MWHGHNAINIDGTPLTVESEWWTGDGSGQWTVGSGQWAVSIGS